MLAQKSLFDAVPRLSPAQADGLARSVTRYVHKGANYWSRRFKKDGPCDDLHEEFVSAGWLGVAKALSTFDPSYPHPTIPGRTIRFTTYCCRSVDNSMRAFAKQLGSHLARHGVTRSLSTVVNPNSECPITLADDVPARLSPSTWNDEDWSRIACHLKPVQVRALHLRFVRGLKIREIALLLPPAKGRTEPLTKQGVADLIDDALFRLRAVPWVREAAGRMALT
jgi:hypothetical protein